MPRVNRDLQRRMAARRERERRRPTERRYRFATPEPTELEAEEALAEQDDAGANAVQTRPSPRPRAAREAGPTARVASAHKPFSAYRDEYAYVASDLRRVAAVIGSLLAILIVLYFVLPLLVR